MLILIFFLSCSFITYFSEKKEICRLDSFHNVIHLKICRGLKYKWIFRWKVAVNLNEGKKKEPYRHKTESDWVPDREWSCLCSQSPFLCVCVRCGNVYLKRVSAFFFSKKGRTKERNSYWGTIIGNFLKLCKDCL